MVKCLLILYCSALIGFGQAFTLQDQAFMGQLTVPVGAALPHTNGFVDNYYPTNIPDHEVLLWLVADNCKSSTATNATGGVTNWPDHSLNHWSVTNVAATYQPTISNNWLNTRSIVKFDGVNDILKCASFTNNYVTNTIEMFIVAAFDFSDTAQDRFITDASTTVLFGRSVTTGSYLSFQNGQGVMPTNRFDVISLTCYNQTSIIIRTNLVQVGGTAGGIAWINGLAIGDRYSSTAYATPALCAEIIIYYTNLTAELRTNVYSYLTNKYYLPQ